MTEVKLYHLLLPKSLALTSTLNDFLCVLSSALPLPPKGS